MRDGSRADRSRAEHSRLRERTSLIGGAGERAPTSTRSAEIPSALERPTVKVSRKAVLPCTDALNAASSTSRPTTVVGSRCGVVVVVVVVVVSRARRVDLNGAYANHAVFHAPIRGVSVSKVRWLSWKSR